MTSTNSASITIGGISGFQSIKTDDGITNKIVLNNFSEISDLIVLNNSNLNQHSNITVNYDNKYRVGILNSNLHILKYKFLWIALPNLFLGNIPLTAFSMIAVGCLAKSSEAERTLCPPG